MLQSEWGATVVLDLFLSGFGGCLFAASALLVLVAGDKHQQSARHGHAAFVLQLRIMDATRRLVACDRPDRFLALRALVREQGHQSYRH